MSADIQLFRDRIDGYDVNSEQTVDDYCRWVERFVEWHDGGEINEGVVRDFDRELCSSNPLDCKDSAFSYRTRVKAISAVVKWAEVMENTRIQRSVNDMVHGKAAQFDPYILDDDEMHRCLTEPCETQGCLAARKAGFDLIMRSAEVMDMRPEDVDLDEGTVYVRAKKGSLPRTHSLSDDALDALTDQYDWVTSQFSDPKKLFYDSHMVKGWSANAWSKHFTRNHHDEGFHAFARHTSIVHHLREIGFGDTYVRARHSSPEMTARYCSLADVDAPDWV